MGNYGSDVRQNWNRFCRLCVCFQSIRYLCVPSPRKGEILRCLDWSGWWDVIIVRQRKQPTFGCTQLPPGYWSNPFKEFWHLFLYNARIVCCSRYSEELHLDQLSQQWRLTSKNNVMDAKEWIVHSDFSSSSSPASFIHFILILINPCWEILVWRYPFGWTQRSGGVKTQCYFASKNTPRLFQGYLFFLRVGETDDNSSTLCWSGKANMVGPTSKPSTTTRILLVSKFETVVGCGTSRFSSIISGGGYAYLNVSSPWKPTCLRQRSGAYIHSHACQSQLASGIECVAEWLKPATMEAEISQWQRDQQVRFEEEWLEAWPFCLLFVVLVLVIVAVASSS